MASRLSAANIGWVGGSPVTVQRLDRPRIPAILLSDSALALIRDVFDRPDLFTDVSRPVEMPVGMNDMHFGSRTAVAVSVFLNSRADRAACWIEALEQGWLFLIAKPDGAGWLLSVGGPPRQLLAQSQVIAREIDSVHPHASEFPAHPRILTTLCGPNWLASGTAAMAFDPLCGDGTANEVREAILAAAVLQAIHQGGDQSALLRHYQTRLVAGFQRHLLLCRNFYVAGQRGPWWQSKIACCSPASNGVQVNSAHARSFRYQLNGFQLEARC